MAEQTFDEVLQGITKQADAVVANDEENKDPEEAHHAQDGIAADVLEWIAAHSTDDRAVKLATQALRPFETNGRRWYA